MTVTAHTDAPAPRGRRPLGRAAALLGLLLLTVTLLRGRLPDTGADGPERATGSSPATLAGLLLLLSASMLITAIALLTRPPRDRPPAPVEERRLPAGAGVWSLRRLLVLAVGVAAAVLIAALLRAQFPAVEVPGLPADVPPPVDGPAPGARPAPRAPAGGDVEDPVFGYLAATVIAMAVLMAVSAVIARRRRGAAPAPAGGPAPGAPAAAPDLAVAAERGLAAVEDHTRSPREAIVACYMAMETALAAAPGAAPQDSDTPSEVLARAVHNRTLRAESARPLVEVFAEARFSAHTMTEDHRDVAEQALRAALDDLRSAR